MVSTTAGIEKVYGITNYVPANKKFIPEKKNEGCYVGVTSTGFTAFTFSQEEVTKSSLPVVYENNTKGGPES
jgi:hypothetical protein